LSLVLIIEDEFELRAGLATGLSRAGFDVAEAEDGDVGYAAILDTRPDLVLCDIGMPGLPGDRLLQRLRREHPELSRLPFLFLTAHADRDSVLAGHELGADDYLTKPIDLELLIAVIRKRLAQVERWENAFDADREHQHSRFLTMLSERTQHSFLAAADVLNHLSEGVLLLDAAGKVIFANQMARDILSQEDGLALRNGILISTRSEHARRIRELLAAVLAPAGAKSVPLILPRPSGRRAYEMHACRLGARFAAEPGAGALVALFLSDLDSRCRPSEAMLIAFYDFTQTEARVVANLALGLSVGDIAEVQGISRNTVHHHLKSIFDKTDTTRQSELISLILSGLAAQTATPAALP